MATTSGDSEVLLTHEVDAGRYILTISDAVTGKLLTEFNLPYDQAVQLAITMTKTLMEG